MGMNLSKVMAATETTTVTWGQETVDVDFHPAAMTPEVLERVQEAASADDMSVMGKMLEPILASWDLYADDQAEADGVTLPTDAATIRTLPIGFLMAVMAQTQEAMRPPESKPSAGGSPRRAS